MAFSYSETAPMIQIRWAETDLPSFATHPLYPGANPTNADQDGAAVFPAYTAGAVAARAASSGIFPSLDPSFPFPSLPPLPTISLPTVPTNGSDDDSDDDDDGGSGSGSSGSGGKIKFDGPTGGLSTGAKAGIGVGAGVGALALFGILGFVIWSAYRTKRGATQQPIQQMSQNQGQGPYGGHQQQQPGPYYPHYAPTQTATDTASPSGWGSNVSPPPAAVLTGSQQAVRSEIGSSQSPLGAGSELDASARSPISAAVEMDSSQQYTGQHPTPVAATAAGENAPNPHVRSASTDPSSYVSAPAVEPSPQELSTLMEQHSQLESRKQQILELQRIEQEQDDLRQKMSQLQGDGQGQS